MKHGKMTTTGETKMNSYVAQGVLIIVCVAVAFYLGIYVWQSKYKLYAEQDKHIMTMSDKDAQEFWKQIEQLKQQSDPEPQSRIQKIQQKIKKIFKKIFKSKQQI